MRVSFEIRRNSRGLFRYLIINLILSFWQFDNFSAICWNCSPKIVLIMWWEPFKCLHSAIVTKNIIKKTINFMFCFLSYIPQWIFGAVKKIIWLLLNRQSEPDAMMIFRNVILFSFPEEYLLFLVRERLLYKIYLT